ncbi:uncharacterized protein LOC134726123 [Mytilus trossulus]|uniref:uncharacterized protein LOC134726123 n=1 Tax=Mytilus trossulus TaxID=6551 RepID=UPI003003B11C
MTKEDFPPSTPDKIEIISTLIDVSTTADTPRGNISTSFETESVNTFIHSELTSVYASTPTESESVDTSTSVEPNTFSTSTSSGTERLYTYTAPGTENLTVVTPPRSDINQATSLQDVGSTTVDNKITSTPNSFYDLSSANKPTNVSPIIMEGNNITVRCSGNVGKPAGIFIFKKFRIDHISSINYNATTTETEKIPENCSYYRTSYLKFQVTAEDNLAVIRCIVVSPLARQDIYLDSEQVEVKYKVRLPSVTKHPDKQNYIVGEDSSITFSCTGDGNPKPIYHWYKDNHDDLISTAENFTLSNINISDRGLYTCNVSNTINGITYTEGATIEVNIMNEADKTTTESTPTDSSSGANDINESSSGNIGPVIGGVLGAAVSIIVIIVITYCVFKNRKKTSETLLQSESQTFDASESKPNADSMTGNYDFIAMEKDVNNTQAVNNGNEVDEIREHNEEYLRVQKEEEQKKTELNSSLQPAVYAEVNEAAKSKYKQQNTDTMEFVVKQQESSIAESQERIHEEAGDRRLIENGDDEHLDTSNISSKKTSNDFAEVSNQTSQTGCYHTQSLEKDENRNVATVSPTIHSSDGVQDDEQTNQNCHSQSKEGYENIIDKDQSDTLEEDNSHRTAL